MFTDRISLTPSEIETYYGTRLRELTQQGRNWRAVCALHRGKRFSLSVNRTTGQWFCHSKCGRGGSIFDFEMILAGTDFKGALAGVYAIIGRPMPERARFSREEWQAAQEAAKHEECEHRDAEHFASAAALLLEADLDRLPSDSADRQTWTLMLHTLRVDPLAIYRRCLDHDKQLGAAFVRAGREHERRLQLRVARVIMRMASQGTNYAA